MRSVAATVECSWRWLAPRDGFHVRLAVRPPGFELVVITEQRLGV